MNAIRDMLVRDSQGFLSLALNAGIYLALLGLFALSFLKCVLPVWRTQWILRRAVRHIRAGEKSRRSWQEDGFLGKGALYPHWSEYLDNLFFADGEYHNASNVEDFINEDTVIHQPGRHALAQAASGLMVTLGFLGTLLGITQGLSGFSMENSEAVMEAIRRLVPGMQYAFRTSIVGVACSIVFTVATGVANGAARSALSDFYAAMHNDAGVLTVDPLNQIAIYQQEQTAQIRAIAADLRGAVADRLEASLKKGLEPVAQVFDQFCRYTTREQTQALDQVCKAFLARMDQALSGQFSSLAASIESTVDWQRQTKEDVGTIVAQLHAVTRDIVAIDRSADTLCTLLNGYVDKLSALSRQEEEGYLRVAANVGQLEILSAQHTATLQTIARLQSELSRALADLTAPIEGQADASAAGETPSEDTAS